MLDLARWARFRWHLHPKIVVGDAKYGTITNIVGLEQDGIRAYLGTTDFSYRTKGYPVEQFYYNAEHDCYIYPQDQRLPFAGLDQNHQYRIYRAPAKQPPGQA